MPSENLSSSNKDKDEKDISAAMYIDTTGANEQAARTALDELILDDLSAYTSVNNYYYEPARLTLVLFRWTRHSDKM